MATQTPNHKLIKPEMTDKADISMINPNWDTLDTALKAVEDRVKSTETSISLLQAGMASLAARTNEWKEIEVTFRYPFSSAPSVVATHSGVVLNNLNIQTTSVTATGFTLRVFATTSGMSYVHWIAMPRT